MKLNGQKKSGFFIHSKKNKKMKRRTLCFRILVMLSLSFIAYSTLLSQDTVRFTKGLITGGGGFFRDRSAFSSDPVAWLFITGKAIRPLEGALSYTPQDLGISREKIEAQEQSSTGMNGNRRSQGDMNEARWMTIASDSDGFFRSRETRGGGLYLEYESTVEKTMLLEVAGNTMTVFNGMPLEGDVYNWDISIRPVRIKKGINMIYLTMGRFQGVKAMLTTPQGPVQLTSKDMTLPDLISEEQIERYGGVQVINSTGKEIKGWSVKCIVNGKESVTALPVLAKENTRKLPFKIPPQGNIDQKEVLAVLILLNPNGDEAGKTEFKLKSKKFAETHDRTFISSIDGSAQYYSVTPGGTNQKGEALFLSVHGAGVESRNQARAYKPKDWGDLVAATNRRPYGYNWEDWGRIDALEVLEEAKKLFNPDPSRIYLTGHSMGGHGTWHLGVTYPSYFAAIAPSAGYPDLLNYGFRSGVTADQPAGEMMLRANNQSRTVTLSRNLLHYGVYVFHGDADETVPVQQAREMRKLLGTFHPDFCYYEYPGGHHWISDESVDWPPIFEFFKRHTIPSDMSLLKIEFYTANPGVSSTSHWLTIDQQKRPLTLSSADVTIDTAKNIVSITTDNIAQLALNTSSMNITFPLGILVDSISLKAEKTSGEGSLYLTLADDKWTIGKAVPLSDKNPLRNCTFKDAFRNMVVFVYGTTGSKEENDWLYARARYDASTFGYRGNASIEIISDKAFDPAGYKERNIILYGNRDNNKAWDKVLAECPVEVRNGYIKAGEKEFRGNDIACFFIYPRKDSNTASVGIVAATGIPGLRGAYTNQYLNSGSGFPDVTIVKYDAPVKGYDAVLGTGFFGNDWKIESGEFYWKK